MKSATALLTLVFGTACHAPVQVAAPTRAEVQESVLRWAFAAAETDLQPPAVYCLGITPDAASLGSGDPTDPAPEFLARFSDSTVPVRPVSECRVEGGTRHAVIDAATGRFGLLFLVSPIGDGDGGSFVAGVGYIQGGHWGSGWECTVQRTDTGWSDPECERIVQI